MLADIFEQYNYAIVIILMMTGLYVVFSSRNLIKKLVGLSIFQTSVFLLYITISKVTGGQPPILVEDHGSDSGEQGHGAVDAAHGGAADAIEPGADASEQAAEAVAQAAEAGQVIYSNPLPHVLILTAIVVGVATLAIGLSLVVRIREVYKTIEEDEIDALDYAYNLEGTGPSPLAPDAGAKS